MITTVTTTTVTTVTALGAGSLALIAIITLLVLLINKELIASSAHEGVRRLSRVMTIAIVPLFIVFATAVAVRLISALQ